MISVRVDENLECQAPDSRRSISTIGFWSSCTRQEHTWSWLVSHLEKALCLLARRGGSDRSFFSLASRALTKGLRCRWAGIAIRRGSEAEILAFCDRRRATSIERYSLPGSPCEKILESTVATDPTVFSAHVDQDFPAFDLLHRLPVVSYRGEALLDATGRAIGHLFAMHDGQRVDDAAAQAFFRVVRQQVEWAQQKQALKETLRETMSRQELLEQHLEIYRQTIDLIPDMVSYVDKSYIYQTVSGTYLERFQKKRSQIVGHSAAEIHGEEHFKNTIKPLVDQCLTGAKVHAQHWIQPKDGEKRFLDVKQVPARGKDGSVTGVVVCTRDITAEKHRKERLHRYEQMVSATNDLMVFIDAGYVVQGANQSFLTATDGKSEEIIGQPYEKIVGESLFYQMIKPRLDRCLAGEELTAQSWISLQKSDSRFLDARYSPCRDEAGQVSGVVVCFRDITQRRMSQARIVELAADEAVVRGDLDKAIRRIAEVVTETLAVERFGIWMFESDGTELRCVHLFTRSQDRHASGPVLRIEDHPGFFQMLSDAWTFEIYEAYDAPQVRELKKAYLEPHGITSLVIAPIRVAGTLAGVASLEHVGQPRLWQATDVAFANEISHLIAQVMMTHNRQELEDRLRQAQEMESLGILAGGIAHDFNNLLVGILGGVDLALFELAEDHPARDRLDTIGHSAVRASELCEQLLAYAGKRSYQRRPVDLSRLVAESLGLLRPSLKDNVFTELRIPEMPQTIEVDVTQIRQVIMNLITNAADAISPGEGRITLEIDLISLDPHALTDRLLPEPPPPGRYAVFEVSDTGCGMDEDTQARMFDPFFTTKFTGRGLGLAAVIGIIRSHQGALKIASQPGRGTTIHVYLPASDEEPELLTNELELLNAEVAEVAEGLVLVVDDEETVRKIATSILEKNGYSVLTAANGLEGLSLFRDHADEIDVVLLDIAMPIMDGAEAFRGMRQIRQDVNVVFASGYSPEAAAQRIADMKPTSFLQKPFRADSLLDTIRCSIVS